VNWPRRWAPPPRLCPIILISSQERNTPTVLLGIASLPKGATIEKQVILHTGRHAVRDEEGIEEVVAREPTFHTSEPLVPNDGPY